MPEMLLGRNSKKLFPASSFPLIDLGEPDFFEEELNGLALPPKATTKAQEADLPSIHVLPVQTTTEEEATGTSTP